MPPEHAWASQDAPARADRVVIWDARGEPPPDLGEVYRWRGRAEGGGTRSLLRYAEAHADRLRLTYLSWIHELGETIVGGRRVIDHLAFDNGLSYWWLTRLAEKSPYKSPISDAIRLLALEELLAARRPRHVRLISANPVLDATVSDLCDRLDIACERRQPDERPRGDEPRLRRLSRILPHPLRAIGVLIRHVAGRWRLRAARPADWFAGPQARFLCSYFSVSTDTVARGEFRSRFWEGIPSLLASAGLHGNWLHHYYPHALVPTVHAALQAARRFTANRTAQGVHAFLDVYLSVPVMARVLRCWLQLLVRSWTLRAIRPAFRPRGSHVSFWPLMRNDWYASLRGAQAMTNLLYIELFDRALASAPRQPAGVYSCENQPWERALIHAWRRHGHGRLVGAAAHVTVRFWDLRYFNDPRTLRSTAPHALPQPDTFAVCEPRVLAESLALGYPPESIAECEALRYGNQPERIEDAAPARADGALRVLVLGDYDTDSTVSALRLLKTAVGSVTRPIACTLKPHPSGMVSLTEFASLNLGLETRPLEACVREFDVVVASNMTSAALDAYLAGLDVVVLLDPDSLNLSPLREEAAVRCVGDAAELADALSQSAPTGASGRDARTFFFLEPSLPRWQRLLRDG